MIVGTVRGSANVPLTSCTRNIALRCYIIAKNVSEYLIISFISGLTCADKRQCNAFKFAASTERFFAYRINTVWNCYARNMPKIIERIIAYRSYAAKGPMCFPKDESLVCYMVANLNSNVVNVLLNILSPTLDYSVGALAKIPTYISEQSKDAIETISKKNIAESKKEWDSFEESWDFKKHPLPKYGRKKL